MANHARTLDTAAALIPARKTADALRLCRQVLAKGPGTEDTCSALRLMARAFFHEGRFRDSLDALQQAQPLAPQCADVLLQAVRLHVLEGRFTQARNGLRILLKGAAPEDAPLMYTARGQMEIEVGEWATGFAWLEQAERVWRKALPNVWRGEALHGQSVLVFGQGGRGDCLHFGRYLPLLREAGAGSVLFACVHDGLRSLFLRSGLCDVFCTRKDAPPHDLCVPLFCLPHWFPTTCAHVPGPMPFLRPEEGRAAAWKARLRLLAPHGRRVGIVWAGARSTRKTFCVPPGFPTSRLWPLSPA